MSDSSLNLWDLPSISAPIMGCFFIVIMSPHQQFDRQFTIHKEVQILTKKQERRTTNLDDTPLYSHANLLSCIFILLYSDFLHLRLYFSFVFLHINLKCICTILIFLLDTKATGWDWMDAVSLNLMYSSLFILKLPWNSNSCALSISPEDWKFPPIQSIEWKPFYLNCYSQHYYKNVMLHHYSNL